MAPTEATEGPQKPSIRPKQKQNKKEETINKPKSKPNEIMTNQQLMVPIVEGGDVLEDVGEHCVGGLGREYRVLQQDQEGSNLGGIRRRRSRRKRSRRRLI